MNEKYNEEEFEEFCDRLRALIPEEERIRLTEELNTPKTLLAIPDKKKIGDEILKLINNIKRKIPIIETKVESKPSFGNLTTHVIYLESLTMCFDGKTLALLIRAMKKADCVCFNTSSNENPVISFVLYNYYIVIKDKEI